MQDRALALLPPALSDRYLALTPRERVFVVAGALAFLLFLLWLLFFAGGDDPAAVELAEAPPPPAPRPAPYVPPLPAAPPAAPASAADGLVLHGVLGGGRAGGAAIIGLAGGEQRLVRVGRPVLPGLVLTGIGIDHAMLRSADGNIRLSFNKPASLVAAPATGAGASAALSPDQRAAYRSYRRTSQRIARAGLQLDMGLEPASRGGEIVGYRLKPEAGIAPLERAGLRPGDILISVDGDGISDAESVNDLSAALARGSGKEVVFERGGRRLKTKLP